MKKTFNISADILLAVAVLAACGKKKDEAGNYDLATDQQALLKFNYASMYTDDRSVVLKVNGNRVSSLITNRTPFPGGGLNTNDSNYPDFLTVPAGAIEIAVALPKKVDNGTDSIVLYKTTVNTEAGKKYSMNIADTGALTKSVLLEENFALPDVGSSRLRFVNLIPNVPAVDLYYGTATTTDQSTDSLVVSNVAYLASSPAFTMKSASKTWKIRAAGAAKTSATVIASYASATTVASQRVLTGFACGYSGKTTTAQKPYVSFFLVR